MAQIVGVWMQAETPAGTSLIGQLRWRRPRFWHPWFFIVWARFPERRFRVAAGMLGAVFPKFS